MVELTFSSMSYDMHSLDPMLAAKRNEIASIK